WSTLKDGKLQYGAITKPSSQALINGAIALNADVSTMAALKAVNKDKTYDAAVDRLRLTANSKELEAKLSQLNEARRSARERLTQIDKELKEQLDKEARAAANLETMRALSGVLSVAQ